MRVAGQAFIRAGVALMAALFVVGGPADHVAGVEVDPGLLRRDSMKESRKAAAHRKRRIVMDNDGNEPVYYVKQATAEALLACRTTDLLGTQVNTIVYCTWSSGFGLFTHNTKVGEIFTCTEEKFSTNKTADFIAQGTDPLEIVTTFCRRIGIEVFWSMRMNDTHDAWGGWYSPYMFPQLKKDHPEWLVASREQRSKVGGWTAVDYAHPEIRDLAFRYVEEVCRNYDIDGVMLDYFRHPVFFKAHAMGGRVGQRECDMMTDMMRRVRAMADEEGVKRGRPILIAVRVPDSVEYCKAIGLDIVRWMKEDLIDLLAVSGYFRLNQWGASVALGHKYGVPVLACLSESRMKGEAGRLRQSLPAYRARALNAWAADADGIYTFNFFDPKSPLWREIGDPRTLQTLDRMYTTGARSANVIERWMVGASRFLNRSPISPERPRELQPGKPVTVQLRVGEDFRQAQAPEVTLRLQFRGLPAAADVSVKLNDHALTGGTMSDSWVSYRVDPSFVKKGANQLEILLPLDQEARPIVRDLLLSVRCKRNCSRESLRNVRTHDRGETGTETNRNGDAASFLIRSAN